MLPEHALCCLNYLCMVCVCLWYTFTYLNRLDRDSESCRTRYNDLNDLDICSPVFNHQRAVAMLMEQTDRQVCDVLLDQSLLPGVGNIIKNEVKVKFSVWRSCCDIRYINIDKYSYPNHCFISFNFRLCLTVVSSRVLR